MENGFIFQIKYWKLGKLVEDFIRTTNCINQEIRIHPTPHFLPILTPYVVVGINIKVCMCWGFDLMILIVAIKQEQVLNFTTDEWKGKIMKNIWN